MKLRIDWARPIQLRRPEGISRIYDLDLSKVCDAAGIYIFGRRWGRHFEALYVGRASNVRGRVKGHLNNLRLMRHLHNAKTGKRVLLAGRLVTKRGQQLSKCLALAERALIRHFLLERRRLSQQARYQTSQASTRVLGSVSKTILPGSDLPGENKK